MYLSFVEDVDTSLAPNTLLINMFSCYASRCYNNNAPPQQREERLARRVIFYGLRARKNRMFRPPFRYVTRHGCCCVIELNFCLCFWRFGPFGRRGFWS